MNRRSIFKSIVGVIAGVPTAKAAAKPADADLSYTLSHKRFKSECMTSYPQMTSHDLVDGKYIRRNFQDAIIDCWEKNDESLCLKP